MSLDNLGELGWRGKYTYDSPEVVALRSNLQQHAGIRGLEIVDPDSDRNFAERAAELFHRDGYCVVAKVLDNDRLAKIRKGCADTIREMLKLDPGMAGNRGSHRYTFGTAPAHFGHQAAWATLIDPPRALAVLGAIFGSDDFHQTSSASGGDFVLPGCVEYQHLHSDGMISNTGEHAKDYRDAPRYGGFHDPTGMLHFRDLPCPMVNVNYPMELVDGSDIAHTAINGATRQIAGTHRSRERIPTLQEEPLWMKLATTAPAPAGCALFRDIRAWHGGTPNLSRHIRAIPTPGIYNAPWYSGGSVGGEPQRDMSRAVFEQLSAAGQRCCRNIVSDEPVSTTWAPDWEGTQGGGSVDNRLHKGEVVDDPWNKELVRVGNQVFTNKAAAAAAAAASVPRM